MTDENSALRKELASAAERSALRRPKAEIYLVGCSARKLGKPSRAEDMYTSIRFRKARAVAEYRGERWFILSAKHGLLEPDDVIEPYDLPLNDLPGAAKSAWAEAVVAELAVRPAVRDSAALVVLADDGYVSTLAPVLESRGCKVRAPLAGMSRKQQLGWLDAAAPRGVGT